MKIETLTEFSLSDDLSEPLRLYVFRADGYHTGGLWFRRKVKYKGEEIDAETAHKRAAEAIAQGLEVRVTNGGDHLVFHAKHGEIIYPEDPDKFWRKVVYDESNT